MNLIDIAAFFWSVVGVLFLLAIVGAFFADKE